MLGVLLISTNFVCGFQFLILPINYYNPCFLVPFNLHSPRLYGLNASNLSLTHKLLNELMLANFGLLQETTFDRWLYQIPLFTIPMLQMDYEIIQFFISILPSAEAVWKIFRSTPKHPTLPCDQYLSFVMDTITAHRNIWDTRFDVNPFQFNYISVGFRLCGISVLQYSIFCRFLSSYAHPTHYPSRLFKTEALFQFI